MFQIEERDISTIIIKKRAREKVQNLESLKASIEKHGQLSPIHITEDGILMAGERRLTAMKELGREKILARIMPEMTKADRLSIELDENDEREDFLWHEKLCLMHRLHQQWVKKAEERNSSWGYRESAKKFKCGIGSLSTDFELAKAIETFPDLKECDNKTQAKQAYKKLGEQAMAMQSLQNLPDDQKARLEALTNGSIDLDSLLENSQAPSNAAPPPGVESHDQVCSAPEQPTEPPKQDIPEAIYLVEPIEKAMDKIPDNSVGFLEMDPPYAIDFEKNYGNIGGRKAKESDWTKKDLYDFYENQLPLLYKKLLPSSWVLCWTGVEHWKITNQFAIAAGFKVQARPGIWVKPGGESNHPKTTMISNYEMFLLFRKDKATFNTKSFLSTVHCNPTSGTHKVHQWEKPLELYEIFFEAMARKGSLFLSPFAGSGNSMIKAAEYGMVPMGCDLRQKYALNFYDRFNKYFTKV